MKNVILFSRVSTIQQSLESQRAELVREAEHLGYSSEQQIFVEFKESAIKLSIDERKGIAELKEHVEKNKDVDCVIIYEISRLSRQAGMLFDIRDYFIQRQIQLVCLKPYFRLLEDGKLSQTASILFSLMTSLSESEMMIKKERMLRGRIYKREQGKYIGGHILFGYKIAEDKSIAIDDEAADIVRKIFTWYNEGKSFRWIGFELESRGLGGWSGVSSTQVSIRYMIRRKEYTGMKCHTYQYPRIISDEVFEKAQQRITKAKPKSIASGKHIAQGLVRDSIHHYSMSCDGSKYCLVRDDIPKEDKISVNKTTLEDFVWELCSKRAKKSSSTKMLKKYMYERTVLLQKIAKVQKDIDGLNEVIEKINDRIVRGKIAEEKGDVMIEENELEIDKLNSTYNEYTRKLGELKIDEVDLSDKQAVIRNEIEAIYVSKLPKDGKYFRKGLEVNFRDGTKQKYMYKAWSRFTEIAQV